ELLPTDAGPRRHVHRHRRISARLGQRDAHGSDEMLGERVLEHLRHRRSCLFLLHLQQVLHHECEQYRPDEADAADRVDGLGHGLCFDILTRGSFPSLPGTRANAGFPGEACLGRGPWYALRARVLDDSPPLTQPPMGKTVRCRECGKVYRELDELEDLRDNDSVCLVCNNTIEVTDWDRILASFEEDEGDVEDVEEDDDWEDEAETDEEESEADE